MCLEVVTMSTFRDMVQAIKTASISKQSIVLCMLGPAGIGKTAAVKEAAAEMALEGRATGKVVTIIASQILPNEVSGITMPVPERHAMEIFDHYRLSSLQDGDILFFDELLEADQLVLSACLTLIESRELMSGHKLPDVQIVAATNPTIQPNMLKENIRQRFVWRKFDIDPNGTRGYIKRTYGFDVGKELANKLVPTGNEYNILTPRSLTKMAGWMASARNELEASEIAMSINACWSSQLGSTLKARWAKNYLDPETQVRITLKKLSKELSMNTFDIDFDNDSISDLVSVLKELPGWSIMERELEKMQLQEDDPEVVSF